MPIKTIWLNTSICYEATIWRKRVWNYLWWRFLSLGEWVAVSVRWERLAVKLFHQRSQPTTNQYWTKGQKGKKAQKKQKDAKAKSQKDKKKVWDERGWLSNYFIKDHKNPPSTSTEPSLIMAMIMRGRLQIILSDFSRIKHLYNFESKDLEM